MPVRNVLVGDPGGDVEHDDSALTLDVISIAETTKFFLSGRVPNIKAYSAEVGLEFEGVDLDTECSYTHPCKRESQHRNRSYSPMYFFSNSPVKQFKPTVKHLA